MSDFPAKRRKTSPTTAIPVDDATSTTPEKPLRPSRDRESGFGLRDKKAIRPSLTGTEANLSSNLLGLSPRRGSSNIQAFAVPPRRISRSIETPPVDNAGREQQQQQQQQQQQPPRNTSVVTTPSRRDDPDEQLASELDSATRELENSGLLPDSAPLLDTYVEPELPPTPTQLGLEPRPEKQQLNIMSSPSAGRARRREPLGPSGLGTLDLSVPEPLLDDSQVPAAVKKKEALKQELSEQLNTLKEDVAQLEKWALQAKQGNDSLQLDQEAVSKLISLLSSTSTTQDPLSRLLAPEPPPFSALISSLLPFSTKKVPVKSDPTPSEPKNIFALDRTNAHDSKRYLTVFSSLDLTYSTKISVPSDPSSAITETHEIIISAQPPFPQHFYTVPLTFTTDLQSERILSVSLTKNASTQSKIPAGLQAWIVSRITSPLLKLDISGLCFGVCQFWEASVCRARMWSTLSKRAERLANSKGAVNTDIEQLSSTDLMTKSALRSLIPHLQRSSMIFSHGPKGKHDSKLLLSCPLRLDHWTGEAQLKPTISISAPDLAEVKWNKAERDIKLLFHNLLNTGTSSDRLENGDSQIESIVRATEGVVSVFFGLEAPEG
ncbi:hypothetical protein BGW36DRAFT_432722 [Talaromyces proteolyticus]|uniref:Uncharacterized protein n=1 Tax=Talaromyces proteolyticus TaxID=1131652 RepID=A0AAD4KH30_9EURO|nr:uncharacterized protein BGW36DRAFT_432722 [Talaromyces proteolyticus]KAH8690950.1 hypothetical protein BGW36DRAFT_432722 [Talaromyces proteolyticus]